MSKKTENIVENKAEEKEVKKVAEKKVSAGNVGNAGKAGKEIPELSFLLKEVEKVYGRRVATTTDFESLSVVIEHEIGELLSASTLKRLWGYVGDRRTPRGDTVKVLREERFQGVLRMAGGGERSGLGVYFIEVY